MINFRYNTSEMGFEKMKKPKFQISDNMQVWLLFRNLYLKARIFDLFQLSFLIIYDKTLKNIQKIHLWKTTVNTYSRWEYIMSDWIFWTWLQSRKYNLFHLWWELIEKSPSSSTNGIDLIIFTIEICVKKFILIRITISYFYNSVEIISLVTNSS